MTDAPAPLGEADVRQAVHAMAAAFQAAEARIAIEKPAEKELAGGAALLGLVALVFPPAAPIALACKLLEAVVVLHGLGVIAPGQPGDPAMDHAAGDKPGGR